MTRPNAANSAQSPTGSRILVIDDEEIIHKSLRRILERHGHVVESAMRAQDGLEKLRKTRFDLVLTDLMMPEMNGIQLIETMNKEGILVPAIMITGYPTIRTAVEALRLGAVDYLAKPFTRDELLGPVNRTLRRRDGGNERTMGEHIAPAEMGDSDGYDTPVIDIVPGETVFLPEHAWATYAQNGTFEVGIEPSFLGTLDPVVAVELPAEGDLVEQGYVFARLRTTTGETHGVFVPLSGQVVGVNTAPARDPASIDPHTWLVRVLPTRLAQELPLLKRRAASGER